MVNIFKEWDNSGQNFLRMGQQWSEFSKNEKGELKYKGLDLKAHCQEILDFKKG